MEKITKEQLKSPDAFVSTMTRLSEALFRQKKALTAGFVILIVGGLGWTGYSIYRTQKEEQGQAALYKAQKALLDAESAFQPQAPRDPKAIANIRTRSGDLDKDFGSAISELIKVIDQFPRTQASVFASLEVGRLYAQYQKYDLLVDLMKKTSSWAGHPLTKALSSDLLAIGFEGKGDCRQAIGEWHKIENLKGASALAGQAMIKQALCYEKLNQISTAEAIYKRAEDAKNSDPVTARIAKRYLRLLSKGKSS
ncbi:MAG: hypothetical protein IT289_00330 [Oligoflexia bacterium]|nr:hypothetical protein [Oligoflexia bacterium]